MIRALKISMFFVHFQILVHDWHKYILRTPLYTIYIDFRLEFKQQETIIMSDVAVDSIQVGQDVLASESQILPLLSSILSQRARMVTLQLTAGTTLFFGKQQAYAENFDPDG
jgi:DNA gyrase/topoisomerase IV subunit B